MNEASFFIPDWLPWAVLVTAGWLAAAVREAWPVGRDFAPAGVGDWLRFEQDKTRPVTPGGLVPLPCGPPVLPPRRPARPART